MCMIKKKEKQETCKNIKMSAREKLLLPPPIAVSFLTSRVLIFPSTLARTVSVEGNLNHAYKVIK